MQNTENTVPQGAVVASGQANEPASIEDKAIPRKARTNKGRKAKSFSVVPAATDNPSQLNFWPNEVRGIPNAALRGSLFSISQERSMCKKRTQLETVEGYKIMFKGERFNQRDLDLWEMLLHIGRQQQYGERVQFVASEVLRELDRGTGGADYEELKEDMARLQSGVVEITYTDTNKTFSGALLHNFLRDEDTQRYAIVFNEDMRLLYESGYSHMDRAQRKQLKNNSLAKWLLYFYGTHAAPMRFKVATLYRLCDSKAQRMTDFRKALRVALDKCVAVGGFTSWSIDPESDLVTVRRKGTASQQRHLAKKQAAQGDAAFAGKDEDFGF